METELDAQVSRIAKQEREKAKLETEYEKRELEEKLLAELDEMKAQLKLFQKVHVTFMDISFETILQFSESNQFVIKQFSILH